MKTTTDFAAGIRNDLFETTEFDTRHGPKGSSVGKKLSSHWVFKSVFLASWQRICQGIETADWGKRQTAKSLYNDVTWPKMSVGLRIAIGRCLRYFVDNGMLPLYVVNPQSTGTKFYAPANR